MTTVSVPTGAIMACIALSLALWLIPYARLGLPLHLGVLYPVTLVVMEFVALHSLWSTLTGRLTWKDRPLMRPRWRLL
jgi:hypothetical protein